MSKYDHLKRYLEGRPAATSSVALGFRQIERILGFDLPASARKHRPWWANDASHSYTVWLEAGWETSKVDMASGRVTFVRLRGARPGAGRPDRDAHRGTGTGRTREFCGYNFARLCLVDPDRDPRGQPREYLPQGRYRNASGLRLHRYGTGPFCRFRIPADLHVGGVYVLLMDGSAYYVGECENLSGRFNTGYGQISPRNCYEGGQRTNCRVNHLILEAVKAGYEVELWFYETADRQAIESRLTAELRPPWNSQGRL